MNVCLDWTTVMRMLDVITPLGEVLFVHVTMVFGEAGNIVMVSVV